MFFLAKPPQLPELSQIMKWHALGLLISALVPCVASAQSSPNFSRGQVPTAGQWNAAFATKQDLLTFTPLNQAGGTMAGKLQAAPATVNGSGFSLLPGVAPSAPSDGDLWISGGNLFAQLGGRTTGFAPLSNPTFTGTTTIPQLAITGSGSTGDVSKMTVTPSTNAVSGSLARMLGSLSPAGTATVPINWAGANPNSAIAYDLTAASDSAQEAGAIIRMTSSKGASSGTGALSAFKIPLGTEMTMLPGSGNGYALNSVISAKPGVGYFQVSNLELNTNIENQDYPPTIGQQFATSMLVQGISPYRQTALMFANNAGYALGATPAGKYMTYEGLWFYGPYTISDHTIRDDTNSAVSYAITGTHSSAAISDASTTPAALNLSGSYSVAAIFAANSTTPVALATKDGQKVCLKGTDACLYHSGTSLRLSVANTDVAQISDAGAGTFTSLTSTGLTKLGIYTYAQLPACTTANQYTYATVTDATSVTFNQAITAGGGSSQVLGYCNGAGWVQR